MFEKIPKNRLILYVFCLGIFIVSMSLFLLKSSLDEVNDLQSRIERLRLLGASKQKRQVMNQAVINTYEGQDRFYIDKHLETLPLLTQEIEAIKKILDNKNTAPNDFLKKRLETLTGPSNHLIFSEGIVQKYPLYQEVTETLTHPVEVDAKDIRNILALIEGGEIDGFQDVASSRPQLIVLDFKLDRKAISQQNEVFLLNMKLLKRDFQ